MLDLDYGFIRMDTTIGILGFSLSSLLVDFITKRSYCCANLGFSKAILQDKQPSCQSPSS